MMSGWAQEKGGIDNIAPRSAQWGWEAAEEVKMKGNKTL